MLLKNVFSKLDIFIYIINISYNYHFDENVFDFIIQLNNINIYKRNNFYKNDNDISYF